MRSCRSVSTPAPIIEEAGAGIAMNSLKELDEKLANLTLDDIANQKRNAKHLAERLNHGHFLRQALDIYFSTHQPC